MSLGSVFFFSAMNGPDSMELSSGFTVWFMHLFHPDYESMSPEKQKQIYHEILKHGLTVRETEDYIRKASQPEKVHKRQKTKGFTRQTQLAINSVNQCVQMIRKMGIDAEVQQMETDNDIRMVVRFPKN